MSGDVALTISADWYPEAPSLDKYSRSATGWHGKLSIDKSGLSWVPGRTARKKGIVPVRIGWPALFGAELIPIFSNRGPIYYWLSIHAAHARCILSFSFDRANAVRRQLMENLEVDVDYEPPETPLTLRPKAKREPLPRSRAILLTTTLLVIGVFEALRHQWIVCIAVLVGTVALGAKVAVATMRVTQEGGGARAVEGRPVGLRTVRFVQRS